MYFNTGTKRLVFIFCRQPYHSDYDTIDGRIAGNRRPYPDIFQRSIKSSRVHELCQTHFVLEAYMINKIHGRFIAFVPFIMH